MEIMTTEKAYRDHNKRLTDQVSEMTDELEGAVERALCAEALSRRRGERIEELTDILDAAESANYKHLVRIDQLEQLCRDMYFIFGIAAVEHEEYGFASIVDDFKPRMTDLGLLEEK